MRIGVGLSIPELATRGGRFSPASLFTGGVQGAWYAPDDFSTLFQDSAGTTPVTAVEQPVRLMLDKSGNNNHATAPNDLSRPVLRARKNWLVGTNTLATQTVTTRAIPYVLSFYGTGSITLSGTATGTLNGTGVNDRVYVDVTPTAGTLTVTVTGTVTNAQLEFANEPA